MGPLQHGQGIIPISAPLKSTPECVVVGMMRPFGSGAGVRRSQSPVDAKGGAMIGVSWHGSDRATWSILLTIQNKPLQNSKWSPKHRRIKVAPNIPARPPVAHHRCKIAGKASRRCPGRSGFGRTKREIADVISDPWILSA